jgi:uncharacterized protein YprB with RNaseH-like and TPR domain|tara:strand:- start:552 stop:1250 length:699 start_codon:yes stop_codon:yes gene_type:complete
MLENINENKLLFLDIETAGAYKDSFDLKEQNPVLWNLWDSIGCSYFRRHYPEDSDKDCDFLYKKYSGLLPEFGKIVCTSVGFINGKEEKLQSFCGDNEKDELKQIAQLLIKIEKVGFTLCGHNIKNFDLPYLGKRMLINGINPPSLLPSHDTKPWEVRALDTKEMWNFGSYKGLSSLHLVTSVMGIPSPKESKINGENIHESWYSNKKNEIMSYCEKDVSSLIKIIKKVKNL